jgi:hypothetical protein
LIHPTTIKRNLVNSKMANITTKTRRIEPKAKEMGKGNVLNAIYVVAQTTLLRNAEPQHLVDVTP